MGPVMDSTEPLMHCPQLTLLRTKATPNETVDRDYDVIFVFEGIEV